MTKKESISTREYQATSQNSEVFFESIIDTLRESIIVLDKDLVVMTANKTFYKTFKMRPEESLHKKIYELGHGEWNIASLKKLLEEILPTHNPFNNFNVEMDFHKIGKKEMLLNARQIKERGIWQDSILLAIEDITDLSFAQKSIKNVNKQQELALKQAEESERKFRTLADHIPNLCWMAHADGSIYWYNKRWYDYTGTSQQQIIEKGWQSVHDPTDLPIILEKWEKSLKSGQPFEMVFSIKGADGTFRPFLTRIVPIRDENNTIIQWFGTGTDITGQKNAEHAQRRLAAIVESSDDAIISKNLQGIITSWNKGAEQIFGYTSKEMIGKSIRTIIPPELQSQEDHILAQLKQGKKIDHFQTVRLRKDGRRIDLSITISPIKDSDGTIRGASKIARDITQEKSLQRQKDDFIGIASHELKTPVTSIKSYGQVLQMVFKKKGDMHAVNLLQKMDSQINKLTNLIGDLLDVTKVQSGRLEFHQQEFDFNELINEVVEDLQLTTEKHTLTTQLDKSITVNGDRERIGQVITNLITNAIKYSPHSNKIIIKTTTSPENVTVCVQDFGVGIPKDKQQKVFEQFFRVSGPAHSTIPGLGLGLYISSEIIKRQGGRIWVESEEGKGSTFCFTLPTKSPNKNS
jgi:PAS domain S-box-containing protein